MKTHLYKLDEVLGQFVVSQVFVKAAHSEVSDHGVGVVTVQQLHGLLGTDGRPFLQQAVHLGDGGEDSGEPSAVSASGYSPASQTGQYLCYFISGVPLDSEEDLGKDLWDVHAVVPGGGQKVDQCCVDQLKYPRPAVSVPVSPEEVLLLLRDLRQRVSVTELPQLLGVALCQGVISGQTVALEHNT